jgi:hypothetical protein
MRHAHYSGHVARPVDVSALLRIALVIALLVAAGWLLVTGALPELLETLSGWLRDL